MQNNVTLLNLLRSKNITQDIQDVLHEHVRLSHKAETLPLYPLEIAQYAALTLLNWQLSSTLVVAILLTPLLEYGLVIEESLTTFAQDSLSLARRLIEWHHSHMQIDQRDQSSTIHSMQLRRLVRQAYLDLPHNSFIVLIMAEHDAQLSLYAKETSATTIAVFVPLAAILGMWSTRRQWLDKSLAVLYPSEYEEIALLTQKIEIFAKDHDRDTTAAVENINHFEQNAVPLIEEEKYSVARKVACYAHERDRSYRILEAQLNTDFQIEGIRAIIRPLEWSPGTFLQLCKNGDSKEDLIRRIRIRITCDSIQDCYRILWIVHRLGEPLAPRFSKYFRDYIASPQPNGYQALHTTITYPKGEDSTILADFRILTHTMYHFNENGILAIPIQEQTHDTSAWWNKWDEQSNDFCRRRVLLERPIGTRSQNIYVFTPQGEVFYQKDGNTALDFAYYLHTELGHHAVKIEVNCKRVSYNYPLRNGDWIHVHHDPHFQGPDWFWLSAVNSPSAKQKIRQGLAIRASAIHEGRSKIEAELLRLVQTYKKEKHYDLQINTPQLDGFLFRAALARHLPDQEALYEEVYRGKISPEKLALRFIGEEFAHTIVDTSGNQVDIPSHNIHFCNRCHPVPGDSLIALEKRRGNTLNALKIHQAGSHCLKLVQPDKMMPMSWADESHLVSTLKKELVFLHISCEARYRLLGDIIDVTYKEPNVHLRNVEAHTDDIRTDITLAIEASSFMHISVVQDNIEHVRGVRSLSAYLPSPLQRLALIQSFEEDQSNPYTYQEVYDRFMFYDREEVIETILRWLKEPVPTKQLLLHGQRRVGKTSLAKYLMHGILPGQRRVQPIWIDFQDLSQCNAQSIANLMVQSLYKALSIPKLLQEPGEEPMLWLSNVLEDAVKQCMPHRLLIIIDEFNVLLDMEQKGLLNTLVFSNLRSLMSKQRELYWFLIVQDTHFYQPERYREAGSLFQQSLCLHLKHLDRHWAEKLITEPAQRCGMLYEATLPTQILDLTNGNPYLIQTLCHELFGRAIKQHRKNITLHDLTHVVNLLTNTTTGPRTFHHFVNYLEPTQKIVLVMLVQTSVNGNKVSVVQIVEQIRRREKRLHATMLHDAIKTLTHQGIVAVEHSSTEELVYIPIKLFQSYVEDCMSIQAVFEEWKANHSTHARKGVHS